MHPHRSKEGLFLDGLLQFEAAAMALNVSGNHAMGRHLRMHVERLRGEPSTDTYRRVQYKVTGREGTELREEVLSGLQRLACGDGPPLYDIAARAILDLWTGAEC